MATVKARALKRMRCVAGIAAPLPTPAPQSSALLRVASFDLGMRNLALVVADVDGGRLRAVHVMELIDILADNGCTARNSKTVTIERLVKFMVHALRTRRDIFEAVDVVAIEQQPVGRGPVSNVRCKVLSHVLQGWICDNVPQTRVTFVNPKRKVADAPPAHVKKARDKYAWRKQQAVAAAVRHLDAHPGWLATFQTHHKKDDLADALLQCVGLTGNSPPR